MKTEENMITNWLDQHGDPEIDKFIEKNLAIAVKVNAELRKRNWSQAKFADEIGKISRRNSFFLHKLSNR